MVGAGDVVASAQLLDELRDLALEVATEAGALLLAASRRHVSVAATKSSATDVVTEMDRASERLITERILAARPDDGLLGEEGSDRPGSTGVRWVVDPLDGTVNYLYGLPGWAVSVGVEHAGAVVVGVVAVPTAGETYVAVRGEGAGLRTADRVVALHVNDPVALDRPSRVPGSATASRGAAPRARSRPRWSRGSATSGGRGPARPTCATSRPGGSTRSTSSAPRPGTTPPGGSWRTRPEREFELVALPGESDPLVVAAGPTLFPTLRRLLVGLHGGVAAG